MFADPETPPEKRWFPADYPDDDDDDEMDYLACARCGSDGEFDYIGEVYDDDQYLGSSYKCEECGYEFTLADD